MADFRSVIEKYGKYVGAPAGLSMEPMLRVNRDAVSLVAPRFPLRKYDVALYQRDNGVYVLHRVVKVNKDGYAFCGDLQWRCEKGVQENQIVGVMEGFFRDDTYISASDPCYRRYAFWRVFCRPFRSLSFHVKLYLSVFWRKLRRK